MARRVRRLFRGGRVVDLAAGHGLLAQALLLLDDTSPLAVAVDRSIPPSAQKLLAAVTAAWPRLAGRVSFVAGELDGFAIQPTDVVVSAHACGALTDVILERAVSAGARLAVLPCCHHHSSADATKFAGWMDGALAIDVTRAQRLELAGYRVWTQTLPAEITPKGRLLLARRLI